MDPHDPTRDPGDDAPADRDAGRGLVDLAEWLRDATQREKPTAATSSHPAEGLPEDPLRDDMADVLLFRSRRPARERSVRRSADAAPPPEARFLNWEFLSQLEAFAESRGDTREVDLSYYQAFLDLKGAEARYTIGSLLWSNWFAGSVERGADAILSDEGRDLRDTIYLALMLLARGNLAFDEEDERVLFFKPVGPPMTPEILKKVERRIFDLRPLCFQVIFELRGYRQGIRRGKAERRRGKRGR